MDTSASSGHATGWSFPDNVGAKPSPRTTHSTSSIPGAFHEDEQDSKAESHDFADPSTTQAHSSRSSQQSTPRSTSGQRRTRTHWPPRTCRICLETVNPTFHTFTEDLPGILRPAPSVTYESSDPAIGRLISPCKCRGSSKYVHEGCLQQWRHADPSYGKRNFWQCPTCGFKYRLERMTWGRWISSTAAQITLTAFIFILTLFVMGFIADPIINFYVEPTSILSNPKSLGTRLEPILSDDEIPTWTEHFVKGLASLGLLGFAKVLIGLSPWNWFNLRSSGVLGTSSRVRGTGRDRLANISWLVIVIGVGTFLWAVYKAVRAWSRRTLEKASERVMDVTGDDDDDVDS